MGYQHATFVHLNPSYSWSCPCDLQVEGMCINSTYFFNFNEQAGKHEGGKIIWDKSLSDHQDILEMQSRDRNIPPADKVRGTM